MPWKEDFISLSESAPPATKMGNGDRSKNAGRSGVVIRPVKGLIIRLSKALYVPNLD